MHLKIRHIGFIYIVRNELSSKFPVIIQHNKKLSSKFLCEDKFLSIFIKNGFAFPTKSLRASSVALINPPFCGDTFLTQTRPSPHSIPTNSMILNH